MSTPPARSAVPTVEPHEWYGPCDGFGPYGECSVCSTRRREFECFFNFLGWWHWSLGLHLDIQHPHIDIHLPFGFARIGWIYSELALKRPKPRHFGFLPWDRWKYPR